ncbi:MAG TPA: adenosine deaminase [Candidatus Angelobacter sp.]|nr:adenosine deaminase [Candidatus Angelobacter sp.]
MSSSRALKTVWLFLFAICTTLPATSWSQASKPPQIAGHPGSRKQSGAPEQKAARYLESIRKQPLLLHAFLAQMPKGGDLHNHLSGAVYAESFIRWAAEDGLCVDRGSLSLVAPPCDPAAGKPPATAAFADSTLYGHLLDAFSMRQFHPGPESGHDHFFATFGKFGAATNNHTAEMLAEVRERAAEGHLQYMELMFNPDGGAAARLGMQLGWNDDMALMRNKLLSGGLPQIVGNASKFLDETEKKVNDELHCGGPGALPGCSVQARYLYQVARGLPKEAVFSQILAGFEMASKDPRVVGLNLVMAEDWYVPIHDFRRHMDMLDFLHGLYPKVHITLHAGELTQDLVPPEELFHIGMSIFKGHAERIGHGVDVMQELHPWALLQKMASLKILAEICLTSNDVILNVSGARHPLPIYLKSGVPVALATDDEGVSRGDITQEYQRAAETYGLSYVQLKEFARNSLEYSFLPGRSLWWNHSARKAKECDRDMPSAESISAGCRLFLSENEKARQQWELEKELLRFETLFSVTPPVLF